MATPYHHTQRGTVVLVSCLALAAFIIAVTWHSGHWPVLAALGVLVLVAVLFSSLTVDVDGSDLKWYFGPGLWTYRLPLDDIETVAVVRNHWSNGFGIRVGPGFRLYNVSGLDAVELRLKSGDVRLIGTDDPHGLAGALVPPGSGAGAGGVPS
jgi:hypothetical protein